MTKCDKCKQEVDKTQSVKGWELCIECWEKAGYSLTPSPAPPFVFPNTPSLPYYERRSPFWEIDRTIIGEPVPMTLTCDPLYVAPNQRPRTVWQWSPAGGTT